jgi:hypothetical protein
MLLGIRECDREPSVGHGRALRGPTKRGLDRLRISSYPAMQEAAELIAGLGWARK